MLRMLGRARHRARMSFRRLVSTSTSVFGRSSYSITIQISGLDGGNRAPFYSGGMQILPHIAPRPLMGARTRRLGEKYWSDAHPQISPLGTHLTYPSQAACATQLLPILIREREHVGREGVVYLPLDIGYRDICGMQSVLPQRMRPHVSAQTFVTPSYMR